MCCEIQFWQLLRSELGAVGRTDNLKGLLLCHFKRLHTDIGDK